MSGQKQIQVLDKTLLIGLGKAAGEVLKRLQLSGNNAAVIYLADEPTAQPLEQHRLRADEISGAFWGRVQTLMHTLNKGKATQGKNASPIFDVFVFGAFEDEIFLQNFPRVLWIVKTIALHYFKSLFHILNNIQNARFFIHPIALSENLQLETHKEQIVRQLAWIENYQKILPPSEQFIPRFYLIDGFNEAASLTQAELQQLLASFFSTWTSTPIRRQQQIRKLFDFSGYQTDFFAFLNIALLEFPIHLYKEYFGARLLNVFIEHLFSQDKPQNITQTKSFLSGKLLTLTAKWQQKKLYKLFEEPLSGFNLIERLREAIPTFYLYEDPIFGQLSETEQKIKGYHLVKDIFLQKTYLPKIKKIAPQENLLLFFNSHWESHVEKTLSPNVLSGTMSQLIENFYTELERIAKNLLAEFNGSLQQAIETSLHERLGSHTLHPLLYFLKKKLLPNMRSYQKQIKTALQRELPHLPDFLSHAKLSGRFISLIRRLTRKATLTFWYALYFILMYPVVSSLIQKWITTLTYDPLNPPFIVSLLTPPFVYGVSAIVVGGVLAVILFLKNYLLKKRIFKYLRSAYPALARELQEFGEIQSKKLQLPAANKGILAQSIRQLRKETGQFWEVILNFYIKQQMLRVYASLEKMLLQRITELQKLINDLEAIRKDSDHTLRKFAHYFSNKRKPQVYPQERLFHHYFLNNDWFQILFQHRFQFKDKKEAANALYKKLDLQELLQQKHFTVKKEYIIRQALSLVDFKDKNYIELFEPKGENDEIAREFSSKLSKFLNTLDQNLSIGLNFTNYIVEEQDLQIVDSGTYLFYAEGLHRSVQHLSDRLELDFNLIPTQMRPYIIMAMRMVEDISLPSLVEHLELEHMLKQDWFDEMRMQLSERYIRNKPDDIWQMFYPQAEEKTNGTGFKTPGNGKN